MSELRLEVFGFQEVSACIICIDLDELRAAIIGLARGTCDGLFLGSCISYHDMNNSGCLFDHKNFCSESSGFRGMDKSVFFNCK